MCPGLHRNATMPLIAVGATLTGGLAALVVKKFGASRGAKNIPRGPEQREIEQPNRLSLINARDLNGAIQIAGRRGSPRRVPGALGCVRSESLRSHNGSHNR